MRFDEASVNAIRLAESYATKTDTSVIVVRDLLGRNALAFTDDGNWAEAVDELRHELAAQCHPFLGTPAIIRLDEMIAPELLTEATTRRVAPAGLSPSGLVSVIERGTVGSDWLNPSEPSSPRRVTMYGFKGGVGRSTATFALAQHLASKGLVVLVVDLDLESPGVSTMLAPSVEDLPRDGIVDHLVEYGLGNDGDLELVAQSNAIVDDLGNGEVWLAAAAGRPGPGYTYLDKLSRAYLDLPSVRSLGRGPTAFGRRLEAALQACEQQVERQSRKPEIVLLDSRSGIHDVAAVAITQLSTLSLLFATDNPQTWQGYGELFGRWATRLGADARSSLRGRLQMVASMVPQQDPGAYLDRFADNSQACFAATLYDEVIPGAGLDTFNFAPLDSAAPHFPFPIYHSGDLVGVVPGVDQRWYNASAVDFSYANFLEQATSMILEVTNADN